MEDTHVIIDDLSKEFPDINFASIIPQGNNNNSNNSESSITNDKNTNNSNSSSNPNNSAGNPNHSPYLHSYYGVYDGHGGRQAAILCAEVLLNNTIIR